MHAAKAVFISRAIEHLSKSVGVEQELIAGGEGQFAQGETRGAEHSQGYARCLQRRNRGSRNVKQRKMPGADVFDLPVGMSRADDHGRELSRGGAVAEQAVGVRYQLA